MHPFIKKLLNGQEVEWKALGEVAEINKGTQLNKSLLTEAGKYPVINGGINPSGYWYEYNNEANNTVVSQGGASAGYVNWLSTPFFAGAHAYVVKCDERKVLKRYVYHFLKMNQTKFMERQYGAGIPALAKSDLVNLVIPIPPLPVQAEIVRILDAMTSLTAELTAELTLREKQYNYYREKLLNFEDQEGGAIEWLPLGNVAEYRNTRIKSSLLNETNYVSVENLLQNKKGKTHSNNVPTEGSFISYMENDILIGNIRPYLKKIWFSDCIGGTNGDVLVIHTTSDKLMPRYLYQILADDNFFTYNMQHAKGTKMPRGDKQAILNYKVPIPPLAEQQRIVDILDKFETLTTSIKEGLPLLIQQSQQRYKYYREQLLTFN